ncbi:uncharacterized protein L969DRAFT_91941 [Mixia osmundae IAM 14324]|uniref:uncharacterized protein n=1 Tax=Mixia osmundae (strain CBS 9802 / IAM 14324 / JCM 22182 / KY 12970) TaxID=764103 RepID=UPI0004A559F2|nr:uncharacterized protein L969DRAFT_91941 [Mixia osmundae IAM 14324]KEI42501.1 hypothetical protein L969DRAFT_91941 [Mixia osmundae IAM 14324]
MSDDFEDDAWPFQGKPEDILPDLRAFTTLPVLIKPAPDDNGLEERQLLALQSMLDSYADQGHLLDPHVQNMTKLLLDQQMPFFLMLRDASTSQEATERARRSACLLYTLIKVRGYKAIMPCFPHRPSDLSLPLLLLERDIAQDVIITWETRFTLLIWLSLLCMLPFALDKVGKDVHARILAIARQFLGSAGKERDGAAILLARLHARTDASPMMRRDYLAWCIQVLQDSRDAFLLIGVSTTLCRFLAELPSDASAALVMPLWGLRDLIRKASLDSRNILLSKLSLKFAGRLALLTLVEPKDISDKAEDVIADMIDYLQHKDTLVRWSAAKYLARIGKAVAADYTQQIIDATLEIAACTSTPRPEDASHGVCLFLAELCRRNAMPKTAFNATIAFAINAISFEVLRGNHGVGDAVRDAAAYLLWSLARCPDAIKAIEVQSYAIARNLVCATLFDREVHCRRAASAAFQELVGHSNAIPSGLEALALTDFSTISQRRAAFIEAAPAVASLASYHAAIVEILLSRRLSHWDASLRELSAESLGRVASAALSQSTILERLLSEADFRRDAVTLHGCLLAIRHLASSELDTTQSSKLSSLLQSALKHAKGAHAVPLLKAACTTIRFLQPGESQSLWLWSLVDAAARSDRVASHEAAAQAVASLSGRIFTWLSELAQDGSASPSLPLLIAASADSSESEETIAVALCNSAVQTSKPIELRTACVHAFNLRAGSHSRTLGGPSRQRVLETLLICLRDYSQDRRGDIGANLRRQAMIALPQWLTQESDELGIGLALCLGQCLDPILAVRRDALNAAEAAARIGSPSEALKAAIACLSVLRQNDVISRLDASLAAMLSLLTFEEWSSALAVAIARLCAGRMTSVYIEPVFLPFAREHPKIAQSIATKFTAPTIQPKHIRQAMDALAQRLQ